MNQFLSLVKKHPISIILMIFYTFLCLVFIRANMAFQERLLHRKHGESGIMLGGEGIAYLGISLFFVGCLMVFLFCLLAIFKKAGTSFYLLLILIIVVETLLTLFWH